jgi:K+-sensing histidine kinase KdpD
VFTYTFFPSLYKYLLLAQIDNNNIHSHAHFGYVHHMNNTSGYTTTGFVVLSLRCLKSMDDDNINLLLRVADSGEGIGEAYQYDRLFVPSIQEAPFKSGIVLGLSIFKQIVESLGGSIEVLLLLGNARKSTCI